MKILGVLFLLLFVIVLMALLYQIIVNGTDELKDSLRKKEKKTGKWTIEEESDDHCIVFYAIEPGTRRKLRISSLPFNDPEFDFQIEYYRAEVRSKIAALNSNRK